ncbi:helix-turn-helix domain-containing protein [Streptomyces sp. FH025]|nr:AraC family transcriptional regulator [Streptomyces sp. FH025]MBO1415252.1 helix-turn-helix domain-containing protein [Streptomyces sp. FH025]
MQASSRPPPDPVSWAAPARRGGSLCCELADPALRTLPVHAIAARCGIPGASDFSRAFKTTYGLSPREHRHRALDGPAREEAQR